VPHDERALMFDVSPRSYPPGGGFYRHSPLRQRLGKLKKLI